MIQIETESVNYYFNNGSVCSISLPNSDKICYIDPEDYEKVSKYKWYLDDYGYVRRTTDIMRLHRFLLNPSRNQIVHHINGNTLDNRKFNLESMSRAKHNSIHHKGKKKSNSTIKKMRKASMNRKGVFHGFHGFELHKSRNKPFQSRLRINNKRKSFGYFLDPVSPQIIYDTVINEIHGDY